MRSTVLTLIIVMGLLLSACGQETPVGGEADTVGGTVILIIPEEPGTLNPFLSTAGITYAVAAATSMTGLNIVDENGEFVPVLATELPTEANGGLSADYLTVTWHLRPGLKWSDGEPISSDDIKFTWEALSNPASGAIMGTAGLNQIASIETPDALTAIVHYSTPYAGYLTQFTYGIFPRHATGAPEDMPTWKWNRQPIGAGPFIVTEWVSGESITMERNPNYFREGQPYLDKLIFQIVPEPAAQLAMMMAGEAQVHFSPSLNSTDYDAVMGEVAHEVTAPGLANLEINFNLSKPFDGDPGPTPPHPILGDIRVRQAIAQAIDYETLIRDVFHNNVTESTNPFEYGWYACDIPRAYPYNVEAANALLDEAGWVMGVDGIRVAQGARYAPDGTRLSLELLGFTHSEGLQRTEEFIVEELRAVGIEVRIQNYDYSIIFGGWEDNNPRKLGDFDMAIFDASLHIEPQVLVGNRFLSTRIPSAENPSGGNSRRWVNPQADALIEEAGSTFDLARRQAAYCRLGELITRELVVIYLFAFDDGNGYANNLTGYTVSTWGCLTWDVENWRYVTP